jgi:hypothetical protein
VILLGTSRADAALTSSERGQINDFVASAKAENAQRVRALVARTDLAPEESISVLTEAVSRVPFTEQRGAFLKELVFGGVSAPSRTILTLATVKALLARADAVYQRYVGGLDHEPRAIQELVAIYAWLDGTIANAGTPTPTAHDANAGIPPATYEECSKALRDHLEQNARWLKGDGTVPDSIAALRAQAQVLLVDMLPDGLTRLVDGADRIAIQGVRRKMLREWGLLLADNGKLEDAKIERVRQVLTRLPAARDGLALVYVGPNPGVPLRARGGVLQVIGGAVWPFAEENAPAMYDPTTSAILHEIAVVAARRALDSRAELRAQAELDANAASGDLQRLLGRPRAPSIEHVIGAAIHALLIDAPRAAELSATRFAESRPETPALLSDAIGALAALPSADGKDAKAATKIELGKASGFTTASAVRLASNGVALAFTLEGRMWSIDRPAPTYKVVGVRRDGALVRPKPAPAPPPSSSPAPSDVAPKKPAPTSASPSETPPKKP